MSLNFSELMKSKTEEDLKIYLTKIEVYREEAIWAAIAELKKRGRIFSESELEEVRYAIEQKAYKEKLKEQSSKSLDWKKNVLDEEDDSVAAEYYFPESILVFSVFFTVIGAGILFSLNIEDKFYKRLIIMLTAIAWTGIAVVASMFFMKHYIYFFLINMLGGYSLTELFWERYIGKDVKFRIKSPLKPATILAIISVFIATIVYFSYCEKDMCMF